MTSQNARETGEKLFVEHLAMIDDVIRYACGRASLHDADAEDFAADVKLRLIENDYAVLRKYEGRASATLKTFITTVVLHMALDRRIQQWGRWRSSAEAKRLGPVAVELETIVIRDGRPLEEALPICRKLDPGVTIELLQELQSRLPARARRPRAVDVTTVADQLRVPGDTVTRAVIDAERAKLSETANEVIRMTLSDFSREDRLLFRLRFAAGMSISEIARTLQTEQKPLYPRLNRCLREIRRRLEATGIDANAAEEIAQLRSALDFGLEEERLNPRPSDPDGTPGLNGGGSR